MNPFAGYLMMASVVALVLALERLWPASRTQRGEWASNALAFVLLSLCQEGLTAFWATSETRLVNDLGGGLIDLRGLHWFAGGLIYMLAMDLGEYLFHRAQHAFPWMWAMHSLHHSDRGLNVTTTVRHFWFEPAIKSVTIWLAVALAFKVTPPMLVMYFAATFANFFTHANLRVGFGPLSWLWNSPQYHRLHHSNDPQYYNANFAALLPIYDLLTGAYRRPGKDEFPPTGMEEPVLNPLDTVVWPARGWFRRQPAASGSQPIG